MYLQSVSEQIEKNKDNSQDVLETIKAENQYFFTKGINAKVMVIDERIQKVLNDTGAVIEADKEKNVEGYELEYKWLFKKSNIKVPYYSDFQDEEGFKDVINLNKTDLYNAKEDLYRYIKEESTDLDYFIIHFGILESLRSKGDKKQSVEEVLQEVEEKISNKNCKLIITSGRGFTPDIQKLNRYFLAYSTTSNLLLDPNNRSKAHLVKCLSQLRIKKK